LGVLKERGDSSSIKPSIDLPSSVKDKLKAEAKAKKTNYISPMKPMKRKYL
jgi:DUF1365 family protein